MRELKFRAWNKQSNKMQYNPSLLYGDRLRYGRMSLNTRQIIEDYPIMQYIGLKDKNGTEIYEGDIVTLHQFLFDGQEIESTLFGVVTYLSDIAAFAIERIRNKFYEETTGYDSGEGTSAICEFYGMHEMSFQVIGNIHETPELLEEVKK